MIPFLVLWAAGSLGPVLDRDFPEAGLNYVLVDVRTREALNSRWPDLETPIPVGSLVKPFTALAYGSAFPEVICNGSSSQCWRAHGHGRLRFTDALAQSCNAYFLNLARNVNVNALAVVAAKYGIPAPQSETAEARIGLGTGWTVAPLALARAYAELATRSAEPRVAEILAGLARSARSGTAKALGSQVMAKTGTAPCVADRRDSGDGFAVVLEPADAPRVVLLVRVHGVPGAQAAKTAARILRVIQTGK